VEVSSFAERHQWNAAVVLLLGAVLVPVTITSLSPSPPSSVRKTFNVDSVVSNSCYKSNIAKN
jgi:hypothetical protein